MEPHPQGFAFFSRYKSTPSSTMTEIKFDKSLFLNTLDALSTGFELESPVGEFATEKKTQRFWLQLKRVGGIPVSAFGICEMKGPDVKLYFNINQLRGQIEATSVDDKFVTLHAGAGMLMVA
jgi:hypothetical protein